MRVPVNVHDWERIAFLHWPFSPQVVARAVPAGMDVLTWEGAAWVSVTPFVMRVRPPGLSTVPPGCTFPETNVRTYVAGPDGMEGLWFLHMEVGVRWFAGALRAIGLPYVRRHMTVHVGDDVISYGSRPSARDAGGHSISVRTGELLDPYTGGPLDRFLTARWGAYHRRGPLLLHTPVHHPPWQLHHANVDRCEVAGLFRSAGLPPPTDPPVVHSSPGVTVRVGAPRVAAVVTPWRGRPGPARSSG